MMTQSEWRSYVQEELARAETQCKARGFALDAEQVHLSGERFLMSGNKLVLLGMRVSDGVRVVIKFSTQSAGMEEIAKEHVARETLRRIDFAYRKFYAAPELCYVQDTLYVLCVTEFITETRPFLQHAPEEQFFLALRAFETQESLHLTTDVHNREISGIYPRVYSVDYIEQFDKYQADWRVFGMKDSRLMEIWDRARALLIEQRYLVDRYADFLTHTDFVPHNIRIVGHDIYLLDHASIRFGNKYESWARFLNYLVIYHPKLERWLMQYVRENRGEEYLALRVMRVFKLGFLLAFYAKAAQETSGNLQALSLRRIAFWSSVMEVILEDREMRDAEIQEYQRIRDQLRSEEEKSRQRELQQT